jgi:hypothetical protein
LKVFIILSLLALFITLLYVRLRPYIRMARQMFGLARGVRQMSRNEPTQTARAESAVDNKLLRCDACGVWTPAARAVRLRSSLATYCSHACMETSAAAGSKKRKTAG